MKEERKARSEVSRDINKHPNHTACSHIENKARETSQVSNAEEEIAPGPAQHLPRQD